MKSIDIWFRDLPEKDSWMWEVIVTLFDEILYEDDRWHYFWEDLFMHIRCQEEFVDRVVARANEFGMVTKVDNPKPWMDDQRTVEKYKWYFERMFHDNSVLSIQLARDLGYPNFLDFYFIFDRIAHCICNNWFWIARKAATENRLNNFELALVSYYNTMRAKFAGKYEYHEELTNVRAKKANKESTS